MGLGEPITPRPELRDTYDEAYRSYRELYFAMEALTR